MKYKSIIMPVLSQGELAQRLAFSFDYCWKKPMHVLYVDPLLWLEFNPNDHSINYLTRTQAIALGVQTVTVLNLDDLLKFFKKPVELIESKVTELPIVKFQYPDSKTGAIKHRIVRILENTGEGIKGFEIPTINSVQDGKFKNFKRSRIYGVVELIPLQW